MVYGKIGGHVVEIKKLADIKLAGRSINEDWPVRPELRQSIIDQCQEIAESGDPELALAAMKVVLAADALNIRKREAEQKRQEAEHARKLQLIELAIRSGLVVNDDTAVRAMDCITSASE